MYSQMNANPVKQTADPKVTSREFSDDVSKILTEIRDFCYARQISFVCGFMNKKGESMTSGGGTYESHLVLVQALMDAMEKRAQAQQNG